MLKAFVTNAAPHEVYQEVFKTFAETNQEDMDTPEKTNLLISKVKHKAQIQALASRKPKAPSAAVRTIDQPTATATQPSATGRACYNCGDPSHFIDKCSKPRKSGAYVPLNLRPEEEKLAYLRAYNWARELCFKKRINQTCPDVQTCGRTYRHLFTNQEQQQRDNGLLPLEGRPCTTEEALAPLEEQ